MTESQLQPSSWVKAVLTECVTDSVSGNYFLRLYVEAFARKFPLSDRIREYIRQGRYHRTSVMLLLYAWIG